MSSSCPVPFLSPTTHCSSNLQHRHHHTPYSKIDKTKRAKKGQEQVSQVVSHSMVFTTTTTTTTTTTSTNRHQQAQASPHVRPSVPHQGESIEYPYTLTLTQPRDTHTYIHAQSEDRAGNGEKDKAKKQKRSRSIPFRAPTIHQPIRPSIPLPRCPVLLVKSNPLFRRRRTPPSPPAQPV